MSADKYRYAEEQFFKLRGRFDTGRLDQAGFDEKLRELMVQDEQGRYWMLGAESGKWYYYDGAKWEQGDPYPGASADAAVPPDVLPPLTTPPPSAPPRAVPAAARLAQTAVPAPARPGSTRRVPLGTLLLALVLLALAGGAVLVWLNRDRFVATAPPQITPVLPPTITREPSPTAIAALPTAGLPTLPLVPTPVATTAPQPSPPATSAPTLAPLATVPSVPTETTTVGVPTEPTLAVIVTALPTALPRATSLPTLLATVTSIPQTVAPTLPSATFSPTAVPPSSTPAFDFPPGIYVTAIGVEPLPAKRANPIQFTATFVNTTGGAQSYNWIVQIYDPEKTGGNKRFGESNTAAITVPPGTSEFTVTYPGVFGKGGCLSYYAQAESVGSDAGRTPFQDGKGNIVQRGFDVCP